MCIKQEDLLLSTNFASLTLGRNSVLVVISVISVLDGGGIPYPHQTNNFFIYLFTNISKNVILNCM